MAKVDFHYIKTGTGELSGPSFVEQTELAINELGVFIEDVENTAESALDTANKAQTAADTAQTTADTALSQAQQAQESADAAQQAADQAQTTADNALEAAQNAGDAADTKAPIMHASAATTYGVGSSALYGHVQLSDATNGTENAANGGTAATPHAVAQAMTAAQTAQTTANSAQQVGQSAQQTANQAQSAAEAAQNTADSVQNSLNQSVETFTQQIAALTQQPYFQAQATSINAQDYAGQLTRLYLESTASSSTGLPAGITYPCYFWTEATRDGNTTMMFVLSGNTLYSQTGLNSTPDGDTPTWSFSGWRKITHTAATTSALGVVRPDGTTTEVAADGTLSINTDLLSTVYKFKGSVATMDDLPAGATQGDVYNVTATDANYAWTGSAWDNIGGIEAVDSSPVQGSTNPVASGGVYTALANQKSELEEQISQATSGLTPDNVTIASSGGKLRVKDVAIGGDASDLASARGQIGDPKILNSPIDFNNLVKSGEYILYNDNMASSTNAPASTGGIIKVYGAGNTVSQEYRNYSGSSPVLRIRSTSNVTNGDWSAWEDIITTDNIGDGITVNNGILSVPEYEGATASAPGTAGLVPPADAGQEDYVLGGNGEWCPADSTPVGTIVWSAATAAPNGYLLCNGATVGRSTYATLFAAIGTTYGAGDGSTTFGLPNLIGRVAWGGTSPGQYLEAGLPNIKGSAGGTRNDDVNFVINGAFSSNFSTSIVGGSGTILSNSKFDASAYNSIYSDSVDTVQPPALVLCPYIKAFGAATNQGMIDLTSLANDVAALDAERLKNIGKIETFAATALPEGWMICDGSSVLFADWPEFQQVYNEGRFAGMTLSEADPAQKGKFVLNGSSVYLPDLEGLYIQASSAANAGGYLAAGLPNIKGILSTYVGDDFSYSGALYRTTTGTGRVEALSSGEYQNANMAFNASRSNTIYSDSINTVQPPSVQYVMAMYLGKPAAAA